MARPACPAPTTTTSKVESGSCGDLGSESVIPSPSHPALAKTRDVPKPNAPRRLCHTVVRGPLAEALRDLLDQPLGEQVRHVEDVAVHLVVGADVAAPVAAKVSDRLVGRQLQVHVHLGLSRAASSA